MCVHLGSAPHLGTPVSARDFTRVHRAQSLGPGHTRTPRLSRPGRGMTPLRRPVDSARREKGASGGLTRLLGTGRGQTRPFRARHSGVWQLLDCVSAGMRGSHCSGRRPALVAPPRPAAALWARQEPAGLQPWGPARVRTAAPPGGDLGAGPGQAAERSRSPAVDTPGQPRPAPGARVPPSPRDAPPPTCPGPAGRRETRAVRRAGGALRVRNEWTPTRGGRAKGKRDGGRSPPVHPDDTAEGAPPAHAPNPGSRPPPAARPLPGSESCCPRRVLGSQPCSGRGRMNT